MNNKYVFTMGGGFKTFGNFEKNKLNFQIYWPYITFRNEFINVDSGFDLSINVDTKLRLLYTPNTIQFGFSILGFGLGFDYSKNIKGDK